MIPAASRPHKQSPPNSPRCTALPPAGLFCGAGLTFGARIAYNITVSNDLRVGKERLREGRYITPVLFSSKRSYIGKVRERMIFALCMRVSKLT